MNVLSIVGIQAGCEEKGNVSSFIAQDAEIVIRSQGGDNEAESIVNEYGKFLFRMTPCGIFNQDAMNIISAGALLNLDTLTREIAEVEVKTEQKSENLFIDIRTNIVMPYHMEKGEYSIKECLFDKLSGLGVSAGDLLDDDVLSSRLDEITSAKGLTNKAELLKVCHYWKETFEQYIIDTLPIVRTAVESESFIVLQGNGGLLSDINWGLKPSFASTTASLLQGAGIAPNAVAKTFGVAKAEKEIDAVAMNYAAYIDGVTDIALTSLSSLDGEKELKICTGYMIEGEYYANLPEPSLAQKAKPIFESYPGWLCPTTDCTSFEELPENARSYILALEELLSVHITMIEVIPSQMIIRC